MTLSCGISRTLYKELCGIYDDSGFGYFLLKERGMCLSILSLEGHFKRGNNSCSMKKIHDVKIDETSDCEIPNSMPGSYVFNPSRSRRSVRVNS